MNYFNLKHFKSRPNWVVLAFPFILLAACSTPEAEPQAIEVTEEASVAEVVTQESPENNVSIAVTEAYPEPQKPATEPSPDGYPPPPTPLPPSAYPSPQAAPENEADADVIFVRAVEDDNGTWTFHVTVAHPDLGVEDYADGWDVMTTDGRVIYPNPDDPFTRLLLHPHENEQPFTRSQSGIVIPEGESTVVVRAHDIVHGYGGQEVVVDLTTGSGPNYEVERK